MAKFVLLNQGEAQPLQEYEGDEMVQNGDHVYIYKEQHGGSTSKRRRQVAAIRLAQGQSVKEK